MSKCDAGLNIFVDFVHATKASNNIEIKFIYIEVPTNIYLFKVNNRNTRKRCKICLKLTIKTSKRRQTGVFIVNFEHVSHLSLAFLLLTWNK